MVDGRDIVARLRSQPRALPRLATLIENEDPRGLSLLETLFPHSGQAHIVGVTGPPGVGKSALIAALVEAVRAGGRRVAILAVDPTSPFTGGAVLGDRIRMMRHHGDEGVFVRSMASRGRTGGLAWATAEIAHLLDAAGFPLILVETLGAGQDGIDIAALADTIVVVTAPGLGDGVQAMKSGLMEAADIIIVNKADRPDAMESIRTLKAAVALAPPANDRLTPVLATTATSGEGVGDLLRQIDEHRSWLAESGLDRVSRTRSARVQVLAALRLAFDRQFDAPNADAEALSEIVARVARREMTARRAAAAIVSGLGDRLASAAHRRGSVGDERGCRTSANPVIDVDDDESGSA